MERSQATGILICLLVVLATLSCQQQDSNPAPDPPTVADTAKNLHPLEQVDTVDFEVTDSLIRLRADTFPKPGGRVMNIMITGVDSRLGANVEHADANHLVRFFLDSGYIEVISIPRDTYADAGFDDTTGFNKLTNVRANKGRQAYLDAVSEITGVEPIHHWVEFGFSQAIGLLELMGYKGNATSTLRVLRARQTYRAGDFQRAYNQGRFIRRALLANIRRTNDMVGDLALRGALMIVDTDLSHDECQTLLHTMQSNGFESDPDRIWVRLEPPVVMRLQAVSFAPSEIDTLNQRIEQRVSNLGLDSVHITSSSYQHRLDELLVSAAKDSASAPSRVIRKLKRPYEQRAWLQVTEPSLRRSYHQRMSKLLISAYTKTGKESSAQRIRDQQQSYESLIEGR